MGTLTIFYGLSSNLRRIPKLVRFAHATMASEQHNATIVHSTVHRAQIVLFKRTRTCRSIGLKFGMLNGAFLFAMISHRWVSPYTLVTTELVAPTPRAIFSSLLLTLMAFTRHDWLSVAALGLVRRLSSSCGLGYFLQLLVTPRLPSHSRFSKSSIFTI
jgi:hypothetical protein